jgi:hypothetical protein
MREWNRVAKSWALNLLMREWSRVAQSWALNLLMSERNTSEFRQSAVWYETKLMTLLFMSASVQKCHHSYL